MTWSDLIAFAGGIGLFLLGMRLMTDGLKVAAGPALRELLASATRSRGRGFASGFLITALVQSSSAVIFAVIGFVNAGLLSLGQSIGLIFGANVGTTLTGWIVALVGFNVDLQALAMPAVAAGMALWIAGGGRRAALGQALTGFGIFFLGLDILKDSFADLGDAFNLHAWTGAGAFNALIFAGVGILLTLLMQSSSAALAVTLTAAAGGLVPIPAGAAMVIGANIGTTSTAVFASLGATSAARRVAAAHVAFNLIAGSAALLLLPMLLLVVAWLIDLLGLEERPATSLAIVHTLANLLGVALLWPFTGLLVDALESRFGAAERGDEGKAQHLDRNVMATPRLALDALAMELRRMGAIAHRMARRVLSSEIRVDDMTAEHDALARLGEAVIEFAGATDSRGDPAVETGLPAAVRVAQYFRGMAERSAELGRAPRVGELPPEPAAQLAGLRAAADQALTLSDPARETLPEVSILSDGLSRFEETYRSTKDALLRTGSRGYITPAKLVRVLDEASALRRIVEQASKAARYLAELSPGSHSTTASSTEGD
jgi:phosphate:Na+ symporter